MKLIRLKEKIRTTSSSLIALMYKIKKYKNDYKL